MRSSPEPKVTVPPRPSTPAESMILAGLEAPAGAPVAQRVEAGVGRAGVDGLAPADDRRAEDALAGHEGPGPVARVVAGADRAAAGVEAVVAHGGPGSAASRSGTSGAAALCAGAAVAASARTAAIREAARTAGRLTPGRSRPAPPWGWSTWSRYTRPSTTTSSERAHLLQNVANCALCEWRTGAGPVNDSSPLCVHAQAAQPAHAGRDRRSGVDAAVAPRRADPRARPPLRGERRRRGGRLPARAWRSCSRRRPPRARRSSFPGSRPSSSTRRSRCAASANASLRSRATASRSSAAPPRPPPTSRPSATSGCARAPRRCAASSRRRSAAWCCARRDCRTARSARRPGSPTPRSTAA